jgi:hypothetical protein
MHFNQLFFTTTMQNSAAPAPELCFQTEEMHLNSGVIILIQRVIGPNSELETANSSAVQLQAASLTRPRQCFEIPASSELRHGSFWQF